MPAKGGPLSGERARRRVSRLAGSPHRRVGAAGFRPQGKRPAAEGAVLEHNKPLLKLGDADGIRVLRGNTTDRPAASGDSGSAWGNLIDGGRQVEMRAGRVGVRAGGWVGGPGAPPFGRRWWAGRGRASAGTHHTGGLRRKHTQRGKRTQADTRSRPGEKQCRVKLVWWWKVCRQRRSVRTIALNREALRAAPDPRACGREQR